MATPARILCLHGFAQTGAVFSAKSSGIRKMLKKHKIETLYLDGPIQLKAEDLPFEIPNAASLGAEAGDGESFDFKSWWYNVDDFDIEPAIASVTSYIKENGPFDGILGFSQGAAFAQLITNHMEALGNTKPVKFAVYFSGYTLKNQPVIEKYLAQKISIPTLHIMGELDTVVASQRSLDFVEKFTEPGTATIFKHPGGHYVPNQKPVVKQWAEWVVNQLGGGESNANGAGAGGEKKEQKPPKQPKAKKENAKKEDGAPAVTEGAEKKDDAKAQEEAQAKKDREELEELAKGIDNLGKA